MNEAPTTDRLSKREAKRRISRAAQLVRKTKYYPVGWLTEIGTRIVPVHALTADEAKTETKTVTGKNGVDDLDDFCLSSKSQYFTEQVCHEGYVVHLYFTSHDGLEDTVTVWTGTADLAPVILSR